MICQLQCLEGAVEELSFMERQRKRVLRNLKRIFGRIDVSHRNKSMNAGVSNNRKEAGTDRENVSKPPALSLNLKAGEKVRVKTLEEIQKTLDGEKKFQGLAYTPIMERYCRGTYTVLKRVDRIFDERKWRLSRIKNVVLLEGVFCDGCGGIEKDWDGCDRTCYVWWKEGWLERVTE